MGIFLTVCSMQPKHFQLLSGRLLLTDNESFQNSVTKSDIFILDSRNDVSYQFVVVYLVHQKWQEQL